MDDAELTKKVIAEFLRDVNDYKEKESLPTERKKNPLGKPNKRFLGRTINSVMKHNERQSDYNHRRCQRKLKELDAKQRKREYKQMYRSNEKDSKRRSKSESSHEVISSASEDEDHNDKKSKNIKKKKRKSKKKKQKSSSSSSSSNSSSSSSSETESDCSTPTTTRKHKKHKRNKSKTSFQNEEKGEEYYTDMMTHDQSVGYYMDPHMAYAAMAYGHINQVLQQQMVQEQQTIKDELDDNNDGDVEIPSDLSLSYHSESSLNISLNSSSAEEDENGILTFKLISSDDEKKSNSLPNISTKRKEIEDNVVMIIDSDDNDKSSVKSYVSLESIVSQSPNRKTNEIFLLSSSSSESEDLEIIETISETKQQEHLELEVTDEINEKKTDEVIQTNENVSKTDEVIIPNESQELLKKEETGNGLIANEEEKPVESLASNNNENEIPTGTENKKVLENNLNIIKDNDEEIIDDNSALNTNKDETPEKISNAAMIDLTEE